MPTVPWIRLYQNWPRHKKTMALQELLGTAKPILCLWLWAAENAPDGDLDGVSTKDIEEAAGWQGKRGKAVAAMIEVGFIDVKPDDGGMKLHNWEERAGKGVASLLKGRERAREAMRNVRVKVKRNKSVNEADNIAKTLSLSLDLGTSGSSSLSASDPDRARSNGDAKIRPRTAHDLTLLLRVAVEREQPQNGPWNPGGSFSDKEAREFLVGFEDLEAALETIEKRIDLFAADASMRPWTVAKFAKAFNGIGSTSANGGKKSYFDPNWKEKLTHAG